MNCNSDPECVRLKMAHEPFLRNPQCFIAGTLVHAEQGLVPIETISAGDRVWSMPESGDGPLGLRRVTRTFERTKAEVWFAEYKVIPMAAIDADGVITYSDNQQFESIVVTPEHPIFVLGTRHLEWIGSVSKSRYVQLSEPTWMPIGELMQYHEDGISVFAKGRGDFLMEINDVTRLIAMQSPMKAICEGMMFAERPVGQVIDFDEVQAHQYVTFDTASAPVDVSPIPAVFPPKFMPYQTKVYNFEVEDDHTYCVGHHGLWVHNTCSDCYGAPFYKNSRDHS